MTEMPSAKSDCAGRPTSEGPTRVLVAEDDPVARRVVMSFLDKWGYEGMAVADGAEAWRILESHDSPRLALLDWTRPGLEGGQGRRQVR